MSLAIPRGLLEVYSTCPQSKDVPRAEYISRVIETARWSEDIGATGTLIYSDNSIVDPWTVAQIVIQNTSYLSPLVAVQPLYLHPYSVAKIVSSIAYLWNRRVALNMLAGGFRNDLLALGDTSAHDDRYQRTCEYTLIVRRLLENGGPVSFKGRYYTVTARRCLLSSFRGLSCRVRHRRAMPRRSRAGQLR